MFLKIERGYTKKVTIYFDYLSFYRFIIFKH